MPQTIELFYDQILHETEQAYLVDFGDLEIWIPKSVVEDYNDYTIEVQYWFAEEHELEAYDEE